MGCVGLAWFKHGMWTRGSRGRMAGFEKRSKRYSTDLQTGGGCSSRRSCPVAMRGGHKPQLLARIIKLPATAPRGRHRLAIPCRSRSCCRLRRGTAQQPQVLPAVPAASSGSRPQRPAAYLLNSAAACGVGELVSVMGASAGPGLSVLTPIPRDSNSVAKVRASERTAALDAL